MKKPIVKDWFLFGEWYGVPWAHSCFLVGLTQTVKKYCGQGLSQMITEHDNGVLRVYFSRSEWTNIGQNYFSQILLHPQRLQNLLDQTRQADLALKKFSQKYRRTDFSKLSNRQIIELIKKYHELQHTIWTLGMVPNVLELENSWLTDYLKSWLAKKKLTKADQLTAFSILSQPRELSQAQHQEKDMLKLVKSRAGLVAIKKHWQKYRWLTYGWTGPDMTLEAYQDIYQSLLKNKTTSQKLQKIINQDKRLLADRQYWSKKLAMPIEIKNLFRLLEEILFVKADRMDALYFSYSVFGPLWRKIAADYNLSPLQIYSFYLPWLIKGLKHKKLSADQANQLYQYSVQYYDGQKNHLLLGEAAKKITKNIYNKLPKIKTVNELRGECAYPGKIRGLAKVINLASEMPKFKSGDILVSNVTDPSLLPIMKKASAFLTNSGGLTCHAAIVARELRIPCLIGTKIATHVFKDGDKIEVDASRGLAKRIK